MPATATDRLVGLTTSVAVKPPCVAVTSFNIPLTGLFTVSGVALKEGDRVLVQAQTDARQNGIYNTSTSDWSRALDFDGARDVVCGSLVLVRNSIAQGAIYEVTTPDDIVIGDSAINFDLRDDPIIVYAQTAAEIAAGVVPSNFTYTAGRPVIEVQRYGAVLDGATDDSLALKKALAVAASIGGVVHIPASSAGLAVASASLPIALYSNTAIVGDGMDRSTIKVTGTGTGNLFSGINIANLTVNGLTLLGNGYGTAGGQAAAFTLLSNDSATGITGNVRIENCRLSNFTSYEWILVSNQGHTYNFDNLWVLNNVFQTVSGNTVPPLTKVPDSYCIVVFGLSDWAGSGGLGLVRNVWVRNNYAECTYNRGFAVAYQSTRNVYFTDNVVLNAGANNPDDTASYGFLVYNNGGVSQSPDPDLIYVERNTIANPRDAGVYSAMHGTVGGSRLFVRANTIYGQNSVANGTIPKGAIALNGPLLAIVDDNVIDASFAGIVVTGNYTTQAAYIRRNRVTNCTSLSIHMQPTLSGSMARAEILENHVSTSVASAKGIFVDVTDTAGLSNVVVERNHSSTAAEAILVSSRSGVALLGKVSISHNECVGQAASTGGIVASSLSNAATRTRIVGNRFTGTWGNINIMNISSSLGLTVKDNEWNDISAGACIASGAARGRMEGNRFVTVTAANVIFVSGGEDLGRSTPTWTGNCNDFIEFLQPTEATQVIAATNVKYMLHGWRWDQTNAAWKQCREFTGN